MPIVAVSMPESDLRELEQLRKTGGFSSRSHVIRHALRTLLAEQRTLESLSGRVTAIVVVMYNAGKSGECSRVQHEHDRLLTAVMHAHADDGGCVDILVTKGDSKAVRALLRDLRMQKYVAHVFVNVIRS